MLDYRVSNKSDFSGAAWVPYTGEPISANWKLSEGGPGPRDVYVEFRDAAMPGNTIVKHLSITLLSSPTVTSITPNLLGNGKGNKSAAVTISGTGFVPASKTKVMIVQSGVPKPKKKAAKNVFVVDANTINCNLNLTSALPGLWDVVVTNKDKTTATLTGGLTVIPHPTITKPVKPNTNPTPNSGKTGTNPVSIILDGSLFNPGATVKVYKISKGVETVIPVTNLVVIPHTIACDLDLTGAAPGTWKGLVRNPDGGIAEFKFKVLK
jgi:hypothetical protein